MQALFLVQFNFNRYMERRHIEGPNGSVQCTGVTATRALYEATVRREVGSAASCFLLPFPLYCPLLPAPCPLPNCCAWLPMSACCTALANAPIRDSAASNPDPVSSARLPPAA